MATARGSRLKDVIQLTLIGGTLLAVICFYFYARREIHIYLDLRPWQKGEVSNLLDRFQTAAVKKDLTAIEKCIAAPVTVVTDKGKPAVQSPAGMSPKKFSLEQIASMGKLTVEETDVIYIGEGALGVKAKSASGKDTRLLVRRFSDGPRLTGLSW